jgi:ferredoxin
MPPVPVGVAVSIACTEVPANAKNGQPSGRRWPLLNMDRRRTTFQQVELGYAERMFGMKPDAACAATSVCAAASVLKSAVTKWVSVPWKWATSTSINPGHTDLRITEERCITCGACAANCPTGAMQIEDRGDERLLILCGTILNRQKLVFCDACGKAMGPKKYLDFISQRVALVGQSNDGHLTCESCARTRTARYSVDTLPV